MLFKSINFDVYLNDWILIKMVKMLCLIKIFLNQSFSSWWWWLNHMKFVGKKNDEDEDNITINEKTWHSHLKHTLWVKKRWRKRNKNLFNKFDTRLHTLNNSIKIIVDPYQWSWTLVQPKWILIHWFIEMISITEITQVIPNLE